MVSKRKQELIEQYEDAAFALMMEEYTESEGEELLREYEEAVASGDLPEVPEELDAKVRATIDQEFRRQQKLAHWKYAAKHAMKAAVIGVAVLCLSFTTIMSVEAWRVSFLNYFVERQAEYTLFDFTEKGELEQSENETPPDDPLAILLGDEFKKVTYDAGTEGLFAVMYENSDQEIVYFALSEAIGTMKVDTEDAMSEKISLLHYDALLIKEKVTVQPSAEP